jgi:hypothetical protein
MNVYLDNDRPAPPGYQLARTVDQAKSFLKSGRVEKLSLDYDLDKGDSMPLLEWMHTHNRWPKYSPRVHSGNVQGALQMKAFLAEHASHLPAPPPAKKGRPPGKVKGHYPKALARKPMY